MRGTTRRLALIGSSLALIASACGGGDTAPTTEATIISAVDAEANSTTTSQAPVVTTSSTTTTTTLPSGPALVEEGDDNETVATFQFLITCNGYAELTVDGEFGSGTKAGVEAAQTALGRAVTGAPDEETLADLSRGCSENRELTERLPLTVVGNSAPEDPESFVIEIATNSTLTAVLDAQSDDVSVTVSGVDGSLVMPSEDGSWEIDATQQYRITVNTITEPVTFSLVINVLERVPGTGDWILTGNGAIYKGTELGLGDDAQTVIDNIFDFFGHGVRGRYNEFDTDWYTITDPQNLGLRGISIEGFNWLFFGPDPADPSRPETLERLRFVGPSDDGDGNPRPDDYATTAKGITVGDNLADLKAVYGDQVSSGSNAEEYFYRLSDSGGTLCFYFGASEPGDSSTITEIATECRS